MNLVAVERDWVIVIADGDEGALRVLNAQMRRIDLVCKLAGPFSIAMLDGAASTSLAILVNLGMNLFSIPVEYFAIARVYRTVPALRQPKRRPPPEARDGPVHHHYHRPGIGARLFAGIRGALDDVRAYFGHGAVLPSFAGALLYLTVLSFSGQMVTYLLSAGYGSVHIAVARTEVEAERRGAFSAVEASWQSAFELCSYASTVVFSRPDQFQWPVLLSCVAVFSAGGLYASFVRMRRGHLLHFSKCIEHRAAKPRQDGPAAYERLVQSPNV
ncbi:putative iron-regulated transporter [Diplodia seriata]|uniref:Solute carrier family 40 member n=1 Tax=Diplodia seriata TaxID=420778 RepID=A0A0G2EDY1_9PEZI|nr:putative iron-regulated transporter [Diplodia seriata]